MKTLRHWVLQNVSAAYMLGGSEVLPGTVSQTGRACVCVHSCVRAHVCVCLRVHLGISFANLMKLIMDPVFSLHYFPDLTDKNRALPYLVEVFQSRKANALVCHNWSSLGHTQMRNVSRPIQLAVKNWNANRFRWAFQGSYLWTWMLVFCQVLYGL